MGKFISAAEKEEKRLITNARQNGVRHAWEQEADRVRQGNGTRDWTVEQQKELLEAGRVEGYKGHHMKSVCLHPDFADNPDNIQFLTQEEHIQGAHQGSTHNATNGYYDPDTGEMHAFSEGGLEPPPEIELSQPYVETDEYKQSADSYMGTAAYGSADQSADEAGNYMGTAAGGTSGKDQSNAADHYMGTAETDAGESKGSSLSNDHSAEME